MSYTVLARRYRSTDFDEIVGQDVVSRTLQNAIRQKRTAHAYLFCGSRGVGKTSMARIFAKALNVTDELVERDRIAQAILRGDDIDVIEIDGASNRGIDEARDLIANAGLTPARSPFKIYIIDEVHMLTTQAFNALLKTMEEPPSHVKFILCTTEPVKVPATIQSRCQRFDFRNISTSAIAEHLRQVLAGEGLEYEELVVNEVARQAAGSMRDGLSLLDRLIAAADGRLTAELTQQTLGLPDQALVAGVVDAILAGDPQKALEEAAELLHRGMAIEQALEVLIEHFRNVMVICTCGPESDLVELFGEALESAKNQAARTDAASLIYMIALCESAVQNAKRSAAARALFDAAIVRLSLAEQLASIPALLNARPADEKKKQVTGARRAVSRSAPLPESRRTDAQPATRSEPATARKQIDPREGSATSPPPLSPTDREAAAAIPEVANVMSLFEASIISVEKTEEEDADRHQEGTGPSDV